MIQSQTPQKSTNPAFHRFATLLREAAGSLKKAAIVAATDLHYPVMDFGRVRRHLESMAVCAEYEKIMLAYMKHNTLTDAPPHRRNLDRVRAGRVTSERKRLAAIENGRKGGRSGSDLKGNTARANGKRGGRPRNKSKGQGPKAGPFDSQKIQGRPTPKAPLTYKDMQTLPFADW